MRISVYASNLSRPLFSTSASCAFVLRQPNSNIMDIARLTENQAPHGHGNLQWVQIVSSHLSSFNPRPSSQQGCNIRCPLPNRGILCYALRNSNSTERINSWKTKLQSSSVTENM
ncbi:hypothetical protein M758_2G222700 [Ceratodon purpureus]|nr:hypothetical protein M758_2G222700 [Ceratodon purpureus]